MSKKLQPTPTKEEHLGHEPDVVNVRRIVVIGAVLGVIVAVAMTGMVVMQKSFRDEPAKALPDWAVLPSDELASGPEVSPDQSGDLRKLRAAHQATLESYAWIDEQQGIARVPIARAIEMFVDQPPPARSSSDE